LQRLTENRSQNAEEEVAEINDIRNGVFVSMNIHSLFDQRMLVILKVRRIIGLSLSFLICQICQISDPKPFSRYH